MTKNTNNNILYNRILRTILIYAAIVVTFAAITIVYFYPTVIEGKSLNQPDVIGASGTGRDAVEYTNETGKISYWTNSLFGGMPTYQISPSYPSSKGLQRVEKLLTLQFPFNILSGDSWLIFALLIGFFIFMRSLNISKMLSLLGAIAWAFSSYFIILVAAGHIWKLETLAFIPPTIAGLVWTFRKKYLLGLVVMSIFASLQIFGNHVQMTYYFAFVMVFIVIAFIIDSIKKKDYKHVTKSLAICILAGLIALAANATNLYHTYTFSKQTMRGGSELATTNNNKENNGLSLDYITQWSYGKAETLTLLIPNTFGGASVPLGSIKNVKINDIEPELQQYVTNSSAYWGDQPFTAGPVYVGAFVVFLFLCGVISVKGPLKWALVIATLFSITLSWGHNLMWLTKLFVYYMPLYNKFRAVSSILVIAEFTIPTLAIMALTQFLKDPKGYVRQYKKAIITSVVFTFGVLLLLWLGAELFFSFLSNQEMQIMKENFTNPIYTKVFGSIAKVRAGLLFSDAKRSILIILLSLAPLLYYYLYEKKKTLVVSLVAIITLGDLFFVDKRYLNYDSFKDVGSIISEANPETMADRQLAQDKDLHYRVLNMSVNTFNDATTSYRHRSIGGYSAAKLQRYQDIIDSCLSGYSLSPAVLGMLDTKYIIVPDSTYGNRAELLGNNYGAAWFAKQINWVANAKEEMAFVKNATDLKNVAVIDQRFKDTIENLDLSSSDSTDFIHLDEYLPNKASYTVHLSSPRLCVFSDIYYPQGWYLNVDNKNIPIVRANYILRAAVLPKGDYKATMQFYPVSIRTTEAIATAAMLLLVILVIYFIMVLTKNKISNRNN